MNKKIYSLKEASDILDDKIEKRAIKISEKIVLKNNRRNSYV